MASPLKSRTIVPASPSATNKKVTVVKASTHRMNFINKSYQLDDSIGYWWLFLVCPHQEFVCIAESRFPNRSDCSSLNPVSFRYHAILRFVVSCSAHYAGSHGCPDVGSTSGITGCETDSHDHQVR